MPFRPAWWLVFWGLLTSLSLNWILPALDHHAAEYTPFHGHEVVGAVTPAQRQALLANHTHGHGHDHTHAASPPAAQTDPAIIGRGLADGLLSLAARAAELVSAPAWTLPLPPVAPWLLAGAAALVVLALAWPPPERPPRSL